MQSVVYYMELYDGKIIKQAGAVHEASLSKIMIHRVP